MNKSSETLIFLLLTTAILSALSSAQNPPILDTSGQPLQRGIKYIIKPAITDVGGPFTALNRNSPCPLYVGQRNVTADCGIPVTFAPFDQAENVVREHRNTEVIFSAGSTCSRSSGWRVGETEPVSRKRLIEVGEEQDGRFTEYFVISRGQFGQFEGSTYTIEWCPAELCPVCRFDCGSIGSLFENGKRLAILDRSPLPLQFVRA